MGPPSYMRSVVELNDVMRRIPVYRCPRRNGQNFGRVFLMLNYTDIT